MNDKLREAFTTTRLAFRNKLDNKLMLDWMLERVNDLERNVRAALADIATPEPKGEG